MLFKLTFFTYMERLRNSGTSCLVTVIAEEIMHFIWFLFIFFEFQHKHETAGRILNASAKEKLNGFEFIDLITDYYKGKV